MNISRNERKALEMLSFGGRVMVEKDDGKRLVSADFISRDGWFLDGFGVNEFENLRRKKLIASRNGGPYTITKAGVAALSMARNASKAK